MGRYPTNKLMDRGLIFRREASEKVPHFSHENDRTVVLSGISPGFPGLFQTQR